MPIDSLGTTAFDTFPKAYFGNGPGTAGRIYFPVIASRIEGGLRDHLHKYPHSPGSSPEKLGRESYLFHVTAQFDTSYEDVGYPGIYPDQLSALIVAFENGTTGPFRLPQMNVEVDCYARKWTREMSNKVRSGETVEFTMVEDQSDAFVAANLIANFNDVDSAAASMNSNASVLAYLSSATTPFTNLFTALNEALSQFAALQDTVGLYDQVANATAAQIVNSCQQLDDMLGWNANQPDVTADVMEQLRTVWISALQYQQDQLAQNIVLQTYVVPATMDIATLAGLIYDGDTTRAQDLLSLNDIPDPMQVPAAFIISYYPTT
jgi:hypothetical protein